MGDEQLNPFERLNLKNLRDEVDRRQREMHLDSNKRSRMQYDIAKRELEKFVKELREKGYTI
tara:strand:+ start:415 stop:600 length:186 start_codon:yes stop_codon:yes gene_type:complete